jgi:type I restriction enzyme S subunit
MKSNWQTKKLEECLDKVIYTKKIQRKDFLESGAFPIISQEAEDVNGYCNNKNVIFQSNTPVIIFGDHTKILKFIDFDFVLGADGVKILCPKTFLDSRYFYYFLKSVSLKNLGYARHYRLLKEIKIFYPESILEQRHIVKILDETFEKIEKAKENAEINLQNSKELFGSYLNNIFANPGNDWEKTTIGGVCNLMTGGTPSRVKSEYFKNGTINWLVSGDVNKKEIKDCDGRITELGLKNSNTKYLPLNSVMIALNGQGKTRGTVAILKIKATCNQSLVSIYPKNDSKLLPEIVFANLNGRYNEIRKLTGDTGNDRRGLNMPIIRSIKFSFPKSLSEQKSIVAKLDKLSTETKKLEAIYKQKLTDLEELKKSILKKAFNGEL